MNLSRVAILSWVLVAAMARPILAEAIPTKIESFLDHCESSRRGAILQLEHKLRGLRSQASAVSDGKKRQIARIEEQLRVLRSNAKPVVPQIAFPPQVGAIGRLPGLTCHVDQVVSDKELLVRCAFPVVVRTVKNFTPRRQTVTQTVRLLIRGKATHGIREGSDLEMLEVFEVTGKDRYKTVDGSSHDVHVLEEFDMAAVEPYFRKMTQQER